MRPARPRRKCGFGTKLLFLNEMWQTRLTMLWVQIIFCCISKSSSDSGGIPPPDPLTKGFAPGPHCEISCAPLQLCATLWTSGFMDDVAFGRNGREAGKGWQHSASAINYVRDQGGVWCLRMLVSFAAFRYIVVVTLLVVLHKRSQGARGPTPQIHRRNISQKYFRLFIGKFQMRLHLK